MATGGVVFQEPPIWQVCYGGGWRACSPFPIYLPRVEQCPGTLLLSGSNLLGLDAEPRRFAPGQRDWHCLSFQPDARWHRRRFYPWNSSATKDFCAESRRSERYLVTQRKRSRGICKALSLFCRGSWSRSQWKAMPRQPACEGLSDEDARVLTFAFCPEFSSELSTLVSPGKNKRERRRRSGVRSNRRWHCPFEQPPRRRAQLLQSICWCS